jgi:ribonuclease HI
MTTPAPNQQLILRTDGAARGNPGPAAAGVVIQAMDGQTLVTQKQLLGHLTNNQAEYEALILGLRAVIAWQPTAVRVLMDSELVVKQMRGEYRVKSAELQPLYQQARSLALALPGVTFAHVRRAENHLADKLCNEALDAAAVADD